MVLVAKMPTVNYITIQRTLYKGNGFLFSLNFNTQTKQQQQEEEDHIQEWEQVQARRMPHPTMQTHKTNTLILRQALHMPRARTTTKIHRQLMFPPCFGGHTVAEECL